MTGLGARGFAKFQDHLVRLRPRGRERGRTAEAPRATDPGLAPARGAHLAVPPPEDHCEGPVSHEVPLAVLEVAHHLHGRAPGAYSGPAGSAARRPESAPRARRSRARPRAAGLGQPRPRSRTDAHADRPERKRVRPPRGTWVSEAWPGPGRSSWPSPPLATGSLANGLGAAGPGAPPPSLCAPGAARAPRRGAGPGHPHPQLVRPLRPSPPERRCASGRRPRARTAALPARLPALCQ